MSESNIEYAVIGAGVIGLAIARALALAGREVVVFEKEAGFGQHTSSRNSEVIHAGLYYPTDSYKARFCVAGNRLLYDYCREHHVPHRKLGKLLVATKEAQLPQLDAILTQAQRNGVMQLQPVPVKQAHEIEPDINCIAALYSPESGIVDSHALMQSFEAELLCNGGIVLYHAEITGGAIEKDGLRLEIGGKAEYAVQAKHVINAGGLFAPLFVERLRGFPYEHLVPHYYAKGNYYSLSGKHPFSHLVYPIPEPGGLGVHVTLDMEGRARFGPDVEWIEAVDYGQGDNRKEEFIAAIAHYWPSVCGATLQPAYCGIRPKLSRTEAMDFMFQGEAVHGVAGLLNLYGIESPGLTSCLAIAQYVKDLQTH